MILEENYLPISRPLAKSLAGQSLHVSLPAPNGLNFSLQVSSNLVDWVTVCTNTVLKGSAQFVDPDGQANASLFYRIVPAPAPATY